MNSYIGITGFTSQTEIKTILNAITPEHLLLRSIMIGVLVNSNTLAELPQAQPNRHPSKDVLADIFTTNKNIINLVHYNTSNQNSLYNELFKINQLVKNMHGIQLNIAWPAINDVRRFVANTGKLIVLQLGHRVLSIAINEPNIFKEKIKPYNNCVDAVLIDPSGGTGKPFHLDSIIKYLYLIQDTMPEVNLGIAGGFGPDLTSFSNLENLLIQHDFGKISIDAEGNLRDINDCLNLKKVQNYLTNAFEIINAYY